VTAFSLADQMEGKADWGPTDLRKVPSPEKTK
jgi:hypothetical protein